MSERLLTARELGRPPRLRRRRSQAETRVAAQLLAGEGLTRAEIAEKMGVSPKTIVNALSPRGVRATADLRDEAA